MSFLVQVCVFLTLVLLVLATDPLGTSSEPFQVEDQFTVEEVLRRYPYLRPRANPDYTYYLVSQIPEGLKARLQMVTVDIKGGQGGYHCFSACMKADLLTAFLRNRYWSHNIGDLWFVMYVRDELHFRTINEYIDSTGVTDNTEREKLLSKYQQMII